jgi:rubrerythrin
MRIINAAIGLIVLLGAIAISGCGVGNGVESIAMDTTKAAKPTSSKTLENLQSAFNGESNANAKYMAFAKKADDEGYGKVASLFRAAARAEEIHLKNHAKVIQALGASPAADIKAAEVKSTAENLKAAIEGETYERDNMYPEFMNEARQSGNKDALRTFNLAKMAEAEHARLYTEALANLEKWKTGSTTFFVCPTCGFTTDDAAKVEKCPIDFTPKEKFEAIQ